MYINKSKRQELGCTCLIAVCVFLIITCFIKCNTDEKQEQTSYGFIWYSLKWDQVISGYEIPKKLRYCFYPVDGGAMTQIEGDAEGLKFILPPDNYRLLIFNCDADNVKFRNMESFETAEAYIPETKASGNALSGEIPLYGIAIDNLVVKAGEETNNTNEFSPAPLIRRVTLNIQVEGIDYIKDCWGELSGVPSAFNLSKQQIIPDKTMSVSFEATPSAEGVKTNFMILGTAPKQGETSPTLPTNEVKLEFTLTDGSTTSAEVDLGESIGNKEGTHVNIDVSVTVDETTSFTAKINKWKVSAGDNMIIE